MQYIKKILILKQVDNSFINTNFGAIVRIEKENDNSTLTLSITNPYLFANGDYYLFVADDYKNNALFKLQNRASFFTDKVSIINIERGFSACVFSLDGKTKNIICYAKSPEINIDYSTFTKMVEDAFDISNNEIKGEITSEKPSYNDEAVATENYFFNGDITNNESDEKTNNDERTDRVENIDEKSEKLPFLLAEKEEIDNIFNKFPPYTLLCEVIKNSKFVKVDYDNDKYYIVGIITVSENEKYICYGVPSRYSSTPPEELKDYCQFVPLNKYNPYGDGFFVLFQDGESGECVKNPKINI